MPSSPANTSCSTTPPPKSRQPAPVFSPSSGSSFPPRVRPSATCADSASIGPSDATHRGYGRGRDHQALLRSRLDGKDEAQPRRHRHPVGATGIRGDIRHRVRSRLVVPDVKEVAMLEGKTRIPPLDIETLPDDLRETLEEQRKLRGAPLYPYLFYARNPAYFRAAKAMWAALQQETKRVPVTLRALLNRRVGS